jgi:hypothetical protein
MGLERQELPEMNYKPMPGQPHKVGSEAETIAMVRDVLTEKPSQSSGFGDVIQLRKRRKVTPPPFEAAPVPSRESKVALFSPLVESDPAAPEADAPKAKKPAMHKPLLNRAKPGLRVRPGYLLLGLFAAYALWQPMIAMIMVGVVLVLGIVAFATIGEKIWRGVMLAMHDLAETDPERAVRIRQRLDRFAMKWDTFLDRFPDGTVDAFYMPDFQVLSQDEARREAKMNDRLERLRNEG